MALFYRAGVGRQMRARARAEKQIASGRPQGRISREAKAASDGPAASAPETQSVANRTRFIKNFRRELRMRSLTKIALVGAALAASAAANADVVNGVAGNGQFVLFVKNQTTGAVYARGLDLFVNNVLLDTQIAGDTYEGPEDTSFSYVLPASISADANLASFLNGTDEFDWTVIAPDSSGSIAAGQKRYVTTMQTTPTPTNQSLSSVWVSTNTVYDTLNTFLPDSGDNSVTENGQWDGASGLGANMDTWFNQGGDNKNDLGSAANLYVVSSNGGGVGTQARKYLLGQLRLTSSGTLESVSVGAEVPLPPAIWLLGSALAGFAGVARRRREAAKAAV
jgi:hypothetical protein